MLSIGGTTCKVVRCRLVFVFCLLYSLTMVVFLTPRTYAQSNAQTSTQGRDLVVTSVSPGSRVTLSGHHPLWASPQNDVGAVPADAALGQLALVLARSPEQQQAFEQFLSAQQDPSSPEFHHWLTPVELGEQFGATQHDIDAITNWLQSQNLHVDSIANSRMRIRFSGTASTVANAFGAEMHYFMVGGERRMSIAAEPQIPAALAGVIQSVHGLSTIKFRPSHGMGIAQVPTGNSTTNTSESVGGVSPDFTASNGNHFLFPGDFAKIYDVPVGSVTGAGQTIAVIGTSRVNPTDITNYQSLSGLTPLAPTVIIPPGATDPGPPETTMTSNPSQGQGEATLDVTRAASVAPGATIDLVVDGNGIDTPMDYVVDTNPVPAQIMTISFGDCEGGNGQEANSLNSLFSQAAGEGISVFVSSGDGGAAGCDNFFVAPPASPPQILSTNVICASSFVTCAGGTEFADTSNPSQYWTSNSATFESALSYVPEGGWNEPGGATTPTVSASGGGFSIFIATPSYQTGVAGVPGTQGRYTPDIAFSSAGHDGYFTCFAAYGGGCTTTSTGSTIIYFLGTSAAAPSMAGIAALLNQKMGSAQGNLNPRLYALAATPANGVFHDVTVPSSAVSNCVLTTPSMCNNSTPGHTSQTGGLSGYQVGPGYDEVTGLGSIDVGNLLASWSPMNSTSTTVTSNLNPSIVGASVTFTATVTSSASGTPAGTVTFFDNGVSIGTGALNSGASATLSTSSLAAGTHPITATYGGGSSFSGSASNAISQVVNLDPTTTTLISSPNPSIGGQSVMFTATVTSTSSGTQGGTVTFLDNGTSIGTGTLGAGGVATFTSTSLAVASHPITAHYAGNATFAASTSGGVTQVVNIAGFGPIPTSLSVTDGLSQVIPITIFQAPGSNLSFTLSCSGLPAEATCAFSSNPVTPGTPPTGTTVQVTFGTASSQLPASPSNRSPLPWQIYGISAALAAFLLAGRWHTLRFTARQTSNPRRRWAFGVCLGIFALAVVMAGCGGSSSGSGSTPVPTGTPKGAATFTLTGTAGATTISAPVTITVK